NPYEYDLRALTNTAIDGAKSAGADLVEVRFTHTQHRDYQSAGIKYEREEIFVGVRALVNGYWGFAADAIISHASMTQLAMQAVELARVNSLGKPRMIDLAPISSS